MSTNILRPALPQDLFSKEVLTGVEVFRESFLSENWDFFKRLNFAYL